ncbi:hypothetical protein ASV15_00935 [Enterobacter hormaechei subsp. steigerwaltii]|nr:hypothetical protein ASV15_00935 [Enterobacter hormaechei subsp. steigerwaltii]
MGYRLFHSRWQNHFRTIYKRHIALKVALVITVLKNEFNRYWDGVYWSEMIVEYYVKLLVVAAGVFLAKNIRHNMGCGEKVCTRTVIEAKCRCFAK